MKKLLQTFVLILMASALSACGMGEVELMMGDETESNLPKYDENGQVIDPKTNEPLPPAFEISRENTQLLPFHVRIAKLERVVGLSQEDPAFEDLNRNRYALGDHNYGQGIGADLSWSAAKMSTWVQSLKAVCNSAAMRDRYPSLPEHLNEFVTAAYGREANEQDLAIVEDALAEEAVPDEQRYETTCLAVLSSMEFVGR
jgi:hypothetical protein